MPPAISSEYEKLQLRMIRLEHQRQNARCSCGSHIVVAPPPVHVIDKAQYGPGLTAWIVVQHCPDSMPFYRLAQSLVRQGVPISDSSLGMLFHRDSTSRRKRARGFMCRKRRRRGARGWGFSSRKR